MKALLRAGAVGAATLMAGCSETHQFWYPAPDRKAMLLVVPENEDWPEKGRPNAVFLVDWHENAPRQADGGRRKVPIGRFIGVWNPAAIAWTDTTTVNVCPMGGDRAFTIQLHGDNGGKASYSVTTNCRYEPAALTVSPAG